MFISKKVDREIRIVATMVSTKKKRSKYVFILPYLSM